VAGPAYAFLTFGEVLVSATGLEFAYSQAPLAMKSAIMAFWSLSVTIAICGCWW
jgi:POT family proton-dependent oligopeptide transporter